MSAVSPLYASVERRPDVQLQAWCRDAICYRLNCVVAEIAALATAVTIERLMMSNAPQQLIERVRAEYLEMPGMRLTESQAQRLCGLDAATCRAVLQALVDLHFLRVNEDGTYARHSNVSRPHPLKAAPQSRFSRLAS